MGGKMARWNKYENFSWTSPARLEELAQAEKPWNDYLATTVYLESARLKGCVQPTAHGGDDHPPMGPLHVITAIQPDADPQSNESSAGVQILRQYLATAKKTSIRAVGSSFDGTYREESCAVFGLDDSRARKIGRKFGQVAIFAWRGPRWSLIACATEKQTHMAWRWQASPNKPV